VDVVGGDAEQQRETRIGVARPCGVLHEIDGDGGPVPVVVLVVDHSEQRGQSGKSHDGHHGGQPGQSALAQVRADQLVLLDLADGGADVLDALTQDECRVVVAGPEVAGQPAGCERAQPAQCLGQQFRVRRGVRGGARQRRPRLFFVEGVVQGGG